MNYLQTAKAQIEEQIEKTREYSTILRRRNSPEFDRKLDDAGALIGGLQTALQIINNQIAQAELDASAQRYAQHAQEESEVEVEEPEAITPEAVVAQEEAPEVTVEPLLIGVERALNSLMAQVKVLPQYKEGTFKVLSHQPYAISIELTGQSNPHWIELDIREDVDGNITYQFEKRLGESDTYSALLDTDAELLAFKYIQKELKQGSLQPFKGMDNYRKLLPELKRVCFSGEADATDLAVYTDRIDKLNQSGELTEKQLNKLNRLMEELTLNWGEFTDAQLTKLNRLMKEIELNWGEQS